MSIEERLYYGVEFALIVATGIAIIYGLSRVPSLWNRIMDYLGLNPPKKDI
jgi:hypothetical protein